jgi:hypothetical protein
MENKIVLFSYLNDIKMHKYSYILIFWFLES